MPTHPEHPPGEPDDDAYVVDTRRRRPRPASGWPPARVPRPAGPARASSGPIGTAAGSGTVSDAAGPGDDDAYVVDTRTSRGRARAARRATPPPDGGERHTPASPSGPAPRRPRIRRGRLALVVVLLVVASWLAFMIWVPVNAWNNVSRVDTRAGERPADQGGYTYLLVGSDSREGLTKAQRKEYATGNAAGKRTDTIMLVHVSDSGGKPVLVSIPRDSYVPIPKYGSNKINAAFSFGGAALLSQTVEQVTGIHLDGYVEIGLGGFASVVDSLDGVYLCVPRNMKDKKAGINLKKGCQTLNGKDALGYVRSRYEDPLGDIGRANRQRQFLGALMTKAATPSTVLVPWRYKSFVDSSADGVIVGEDTSLRDAVRVLQAMRSVSNGEGLSLTVPIQTMALRTSNAGIAVKWDTARAKQLFAALRDDEPLTAPPEGTTITK